MKINIISVGKLSAEYKQLSAHYSKMIKWKLKETELTYSKKFIITHAIKRIISILL